MGALILAASVTADQSPQGLSPEEWANIQQQIEIERHKVTVSDRPGRIYQTDNPLQKFTAHFGAEDVVIAPRGRDESAWELRLRLTSWGAAEDLKQVEFATASAEGSRVEYRRGPLSEWYVNTAMGLEQGFTIDAPPADDIDELVLEMTLDGVLTPTLSENGQSITFRREGSNTALTYSGLAAWDALTTPLDARMELSGGGTCLRLVVFVTDAAWPVTVDPIFAHVAKLLPTSDINAAEANFGRSVSVDGDILVAGLAEEVHGTEIGAAYVFQRDHGGPDRWGLVTKITAADGIPDNEFGRSVSVSGDTIVVGAYRDNTVSWYLTGSAYVFQRDHGGPDAWGQLAKLVASDASDDDYFGYSVTISGDTVLAGAFGDDDNGSRSGSAYIFRRDHGGPDAWGQVAKITAADGEADDEFGFSVAIGGDTAVVGSRNDGDIGSDAGAAYVFRRDQGGPGAWGQAAKITAADGASSDEFGFSVAISADTAVVGAPRDDDGGWSSGSAYVFERDQGGPENWGQTAKLVASDGEQYDSFGWSVAISSDIAVVGAQWDDVGTGSAYVFDRNQGGAGAWGQVIKLVAANREEYDSFGWSVAASADTVVAGAQGDDDTGENSGSAYIFERDQGGPGGWGQLTKLPCPPAYSARHDSFGLSAAVSGDTAVVGATGDDDLGEGAGSAYIFQLDHGAPGSWGQVAKLTADDGAPADSFGSSVAISGDTAVVGADAADTGTGSAYIFRRDHGGPNAWGQVAKITAVDAAERDFFGCSVTLSGDTAIVGAKGDDDNGSSSGSAYVFRRDAGGPDNWGKVAKVTPSDPMSGDEFGTSVAISGDIAIIGAPFDQATLDRSGSASVFYRDHGGPDTWGEAATITPVTGWFYERFGCAVAISGDTAVVGETNFRHSGWVFFYQRDHGGPDAWGQLVKRRAADAADNDYFGTSVSISGDTAVVGAPYDDEGHPVLDTGSVSIFRRDHGGPDAWGQVAKLTAADGGGGDHLGSSVSVGGGIAVLGAPEDDDLGEDSGSVYVFDVGDILFGDDFESRDTSLWSMTVP